MSLKKYTTRLSIATFIALGLTSSTGWSATQRATTQRAAVPLSATSKHISAPIESKVDNLTQGISHYQIDSFDLSPGGEAVVFEGRLSPEQPSQIYYQALGLDAKTLQPSGEACHQPLFSPDSTAVKYKVASICCSVDESCSVRVIDETGRSMPIDLDESTGLSEAAYSGDDKVTTMAWSQDGSRLAFVAKANPQKDAEGYYVYVKSFSTGPSLEKNNLNGLVSPFFAAKALPYNLQWSDSGEYLYLNADEPNATALYRLSAGQHLYKYPIDRLAKISPYTLWGESAVAVQSSTVPKVEGSACDTPLTALDLQTGQYTPFLPSRAVEGGLAHHCYWSVSHTIDKNYLVVGMTRQVAESSFDKNSSDAGMKNLYLLDTTTQQLSNLTQLTRLNSPVDQMNLKGQKLAYLQKRVASAEGKDVVTLVSLPYLSSSFSKNGDIPLSEPADLSLSFEAEMSDLNLKTLATLDFKNLESFDVTRDGKVLVVQGQKDATRKEDVLVRVIGKPALTSISPAGQQCYNPQFSPQSSSDSFDIAMVCCDTNKGNVCELNVYNSTTLTNHVLVKELDYEEQENFFDWSPDGQRLAYAKANGVMSVLVSEKSTKEIVSYISDDVVSQISWAPSGSHVYFVGSVKNGKTSSLYRKKLGGELQQYSIDQGMDISSYDYKRESIYLTSVPSQMSSSPSSVSCQRDLLGSSVGVGITNPLFDSVMPSEADCYEQIKLMESSPYLFTTLSQETKNISLKMGNTQSDMWQASEATQIYVFNLNTNQYQKLVPQTTENQSIESFVLSKNILAYHQSVDDEVSNDTLVIAEVQLAKKDKAGTPLEDIEIASDDGEISASDEAEVADVSDVEELDPSQEETSDTSTTEDADGGEDQEDDEIDFNVFR